MRRDARHTLVLLVVLLPPLLYLALWYLAPMGLMAVYSFWSFEDFRPKRDFSLQNYADIVTDPRLSGVLLRTLWVSITTTVLALLLGFPTAYFLAKKVTRFQQLLVVLAIAPLWTSYLVRNFAWLPMLTRKGFINTSLERFGLIDAPLDWLLFSSTAVSIVMVGVYLPYMILPTYAVLERLDKRYLEASWDLGAGGWQTFLYVILPLSRAGLAVGALFVFVLSMGSYVTPALVGGTDGVMIGNEIATQFITLGNYPLGATMALVLMAIVLVLASLFLRAGQLGVTRRQ